MWGACYLKAQGAYHSLEIPRHRTSRGEQPFLVPPGFEPWSVPPSAEEVTITLLGRQTEVTIAKHNLGNFAKKKVVATPDKRSIICVNTFAHLFSRSLL
jgi:hypothetical protein